MRNTGLAPKAALTHPRLMGGGMKYCHPRHFQYIPVCILCIYKSFLANVRHKAGLLPDSLSSGVTLALRLKTGSHYAVASRLNPRLAGKPLVGTAAVLLHPPAGHCLSHRIPLDDGLRDSLPMQLTVADPGLSVSGASGLYCRYWRRRTLGRLAGGVSSCHNLQVLSQACRRV